MGQDTTYRLTRKSFEAGGMYSSLVMNRFADVFNAQPPTKMIGPWTYLVISSSDSLYNLWAPAKDFKLITLIVPSFVEVETMIVQKLQYLVFFLSITISCQPPIILYSSELPFHPPMIVGAVYISPSSWGTSKSTF